MSHSYIAAEMNRSAAYIGVTATVLCAVAYYFLAEYGDRTHFNALMISMALAFVGYALWWWKKEQFAVRDVIIMAVIFRGVFLFSTPHLSDDVYRFIWDGRLVAEGINPFAYTPEQLIAVGNNANDAELKWIYDHLNSPTYYSVYPPVCQVVWGGICSLSHSLEGQVMLLKIFVFLFEFFTLFLIHRTLILLQKPSYLLGIYALNPLVIVELTGNLHPEVFMITYVALMIYALQFHFNRSWLIIAGVALGLAISAKLLPLLIVPFLPKWLGWKKAIIVSAIAGALTFILFLPFLSAELVQHVAESLDLYFQQFEFNASIYYITRFFVQLKTGYNEIDLIGPRLGLAAAAIILFLAFYKKLRWYIYDLLALAFTVHLLFATTVHPWYLCILVLLSVYAQWRYTLVWSALVLLSYSHYNIGIWAENYWLIAAEYALFVGGMFFEFKVQCSKTGKLQSL